MTITTTSSLVINADFCLYGLFVNKIDTGGGGGGGGDMSTQILRIILIIIITIIIIIIGSKCK
ncbi:hypothetical protein TYRP_003166 [Tyrophagus putrescentiae]|nr:hypothetical protein TYRP_003166 [Tyrophagus putrescentiae]